MCTLKVWLDSRSRRGKRGRERDLDPSIPSTFPSFVPAGRSAHDGLHRIGPLCAEVEARSSRGPEIQSPESLCFSFRQLDAFLFIFPLLVLQCRHTRSSSIVDQHASETVADVEGGEGGGRLWESEENQPASLFCAHFVLLSQLSSFSFSSQIHTSRCETIS